MDEDDMTALKVNNSSNAFSNDDHSLGIFTNGIKFITN
jgi:hypothetical protein